MPINRRKVGLAPRGIKDMYYYQWGNHGHKYFFIQGNHVQEEKAYRAALAQARAAYSHGYEGP